MAFLFYCWKIFIFVQKRKKYNQNKFFMERRVLLFIFCLTAFFPAFAQITDELGNIHFAKANNMIETLVNKGDIYLGTASTKPAYPGGKDKMALDIEKNIAYSASQSISVEVRFLISNEGEVSIPFLMKPSGNEKFDAAALRVVREMNDWIPAKVKDEFVSCYHTITVKYDPTMILPLIPAKVGEGEIYETVDVQAEFADGQAALFKWLSMNVKYPAVCRENNIQGKVIVRFVVEIDGGVTSLTIFRSSGEKMLDDEALRVCAQMPRWFPAKYKGKAVRSYYTLPVVFKLEG
jgi:TonB family protein